MNEQQVRKIVDEEIRKKLFQLPKIPPHRHNGVDNIKIPEPSIIIPTPVLGSVDMSHQTTYTLNLTNKGLAPTRVTFYGGALNVSAGVHAFIVGTAIFGANVRFQPSTTTSVIAGSIVENIIQGSGSITMINGSGGGGGGTSFLKNSQGHIVYAEYPSGTLVAVADDTDVNASFVTVKVIVLLPNWTISGLWIVE